MEFHWNKTGIKQTKVEILYLTLHILPIYRATYFSLLSLLFLHLFKSVSQFFSVAEVQSRTDGSDQTGRTELTVQFRFWFLFGLGLSVLVHGSGE